MSRQPEWPLGLPTRLRPVRVLGAGTTSTVWQVRDTEIGADRAVKVVWHRPGSVLDPARRAETEARAAARLGGLDGVLALREVGRTEAGDAWLVHDLAPGGDLSARAPQSAADVARLGTRLATVLGLAHGRRVHHGDISPGNVLFDATDQPLLADFGMAGLGHAPDDPGGLTPAFAAPERLRGAAPDGPSDVWSLGATLAHVAATDDSSALATAVAQVLDRCRCVVPSERPSPAELADAFARALRR